MKNCANHRYDFERRAQRGYPEFVIAPSVTARYARPRRSWRIWAVVIVLALLLGVAPIVIARALALTLWGAA